MPLHATFDCIIIGGGHAGCEAAMAAARLGLSTALVSSNIDHLGQLSCNPAIGGLAKGHMVREIDALGGMMGLWADEATIQSRVLNESKGPAVRAPRAQMDRERYMSAVKRDLHACPNLTVIQDMVSRLTLSAGRVTGLHTVSGQHFAARAVCVTAGTFLRGLMHMGGHSQPGGRMGDLAAMELSLSLEEAGVSLRRFMTCTPPRVLSATVNTAALQEQPGGEHIHPFSFHGPAPSLPQLPCLLTWTTPATHAVIQQGLGLSPMYNGAIPGPGPRYCPSIEDKIARFPHKERHQVFIEPEGLESGESYINNLPTGLPFSVQQAMLHSIPGLEECRISRPGYAIEYDCIDSRILQPTLETKHLPGLWFAGQVNGTSGYEEAAAQGLWAALNIYCSLSGRPPFLPGRDVSYISVLVDDLVTKGTDEPYRMFTSRAEYRLLLREGTADARLTPLGRELGLVGDGQWQLFTAKNTVLHEITALLREHTIKPDAAARELFARMETPPPAQTVSLAELLRRPGMSIEKLALFLPRLLDYAPAIRTEAAVQLMYEGYLTRQTQLARQAESLEDTPLPPDCDYTAVAGLSREAVEKLSAIQPRTLGQAGRISGITPAALGCIRIYLRKRELASGV